MNVTFEAFGKTRQGTITTGRYADNGRLAVSVLLDTGEPWATLSVNVPMFGTKIHRLEPDEFVAKTYSENEGLCEQFEEKGLIRKTEHTVEVGHAGPQPIYQLLLEDIN
jgi:hypothetical protein